MQLDSVSALLQFFNDIDIFFVIFIRILGFFIIMPVFSGSNIPNVVKLGFSACFAMLIHLTGSVSAVSYDNTIFGYGLLAVQEFFTGFMVGFVVYLVFSLIYFAGQLIDYQIGFSMMTVYDPISQIQVPIMGNLLYSAVCVVLIITGGLHAIIRAFHESFQLVPIGTAKLVGNGNLMWNIVQLLINFFVISVKISMPIVGSILIIDIALGLLVKSVPQMNVFTVGTPLKLLGGLLILAVIIPYFSTIYQYTFNEAYNAVIDIIRRMVP